MRDQEQSEEKLGRRQKFLEENKAKEGVKTTESACE